MTDDLAAVRHRVAHTARALADDGLVLGSAGNVSERIGDHVAITATGARLETLELDQVSVVDLDGDLVDGQFEPTSELDLHLGIYRRFPAGAVIHTHAPMACAVSCVLEELPCVHYQMLALGGPINVAPYRTFGTPELADVTLAALESHTAALMANHGAIVYADTLDRALEHTRLLEWACTIYWRAAAIGAPSELDAHARTAVIEAVVARGYGTPRKVTK